MKNLVTHLEDFDDDVRIVKFKHKEKFDDEAVSKPARRRNKKRRRQKRQVVV